MVRMDLGKNRGLLLRDEAEHEAKVSVKTTLGSGLGIRSLVGLSP